MSYKAAFQELISLVKNTRAAQREYFYNKTAVNLMAAKDAERTLDTWINQFNDDTTANSLF